jgi:hypothetical protein
MTRLIKFFITTPRDLEMQKLSLGDISDMMAETNSQSLRLPRSFANTLKMVLKPEVVSCDIEDHSKVNVKFVKKFA